MIYTDFYIFISQITFGIIRLYLFHEKRYVVTAHTRSKREFPILNSTENKCRGAWPLAELARTVRHHVATSELARFYWVQRFLVTYSVKRLSDKITGARILTYMQERILSTHMLKRRPKTNCAFDSRNFVWLRKIKQP